MKTDLTFGFAVSCFLKACRCQTDIAKQRVFFVLLSHRRVNKAAIGLLSVMPEPFGGGASFMQTSKVGGEKILPFKEKCNGS